jgi:hypothetical protein
VGPRGGGGGGGAWLWNHSPGRGPKSSKTQHQMRGWTMIPMALEEEKDGAQCVPARFGGCGVAGSARGHERFVRGGN